MEKTLRYTEKTVNNGRSLGGREFMEGDGHDEEESFVST